VLIEFKVANYRSIRAEQTLSMVASNYSDELPQNLISCDHVPGLKGTKLVKAVALYGANASGKSNIVAALRFFAEFVRDSATRLQPGAPTGAQPFKLDPACLTEPIKFEITAVINGIRTLYGIEMTRERVTSEYLVAYPKGRPQVWLERNWDPSEGKYEWSDSTKSFKHDEALHERTRENAAFVSVAAQFNLDRAKDVADWFSKRLQFLDQEQSFQAGGAARNLVGNKDTHPHFAQLLAAADLGIGGIQTRPVPQGDLPSEIKRLAARHGTEFPLEKLQKLMTDEAVPVDFQSAVEVLSARLQMPELLHRGVGTALVPLDFILEESLGTRRYFDLLAELIAASSKGILSVTDEIETSLHPGLLRIIIEGIAQAHTSALGAQLIFTTHNPLLLDQTLLRRDQIWFTEKDQEGATRLYPLTDFKPRKDESLVKGYLAGRYGGIPFIPEGLKF
jgi:hypothetical protein